MRKRKAILVPLYLVTEKFPMYPMPDLVIWKRKAILIPLYSVTEMFPMVKMPGLVMWDTFMPVVQEKLMAPITLGEEENAVRLLLCVGIHHIWHFVAILTVNYKIFFFIPVAVQLLYWRYMPVFVGSGSLYIVDKSPGYGVG